MKAMSGGTFTALLIAGGMAFGSMVPAEAAAKDFGARLEVGPDFSYSKTKDGSSRSWGAGLYAAADVWGLGPLGVMTHFTKGVSLSNLSLSSDGVVPTLTYLTEVDFGPTLNFGFGPARLRVGAGPWFGLSTVSEETTDSLDAEDLVIDWTDASFLGAVAEARLDVNLPILSPFVILRGRTQGALNLEGGDVTDEASYRGIDAQATGGVRLNLIPFLKLGIAGYIGYARSSMNPLEASNPTNRYGVDLWLVGSL